MSPYDYYHQQMVYWLSVAFLSPIIWAIAINFEVAKETVKINGPPSYKKHTPDYTESFTKYGQKVDKSELLVDDDRLLDELTE
jgi:hypothetical protein